MKYKNVLGKDFKRKEDAYKHFQLLLALINYLKNTEV